MLFPCFPLKTSEGVRCSFGALNPALNCRTLLEAVRKTHSNTSSVSCSPPCMAWRTQRSQHHVIGSHGDRITQKEFPFRASRRIQGLMTM